MAKRGSVAILAQVSGPPRSARPIMKRPAATVAAAKNPSAAKVVIKKRPAAATVAAKNPSAAKVVIKRRPAAKGATKVKKSSSRIHSAALKTGSSSRSARLGVALGGFEELVSVTGPASSPGTVRWWVGLAAALALVVVKGRCCCWLR